MIRLQDKVRSGAQFHLSFVSFVERCDFKMIEKYFYIESVKARGLLSQIKQMKASKRGIDRHVYFIDEYAVLTTQRIKLRNVTTRDDDLFYFDDLIRTLMSLWKQGVAVVPILGYCYEPDSENGTGYIIQMRAKGEELYDDAVMKEYYVWAQNNPDSAYLSSDLDAKEYIISRTNFISKIPQKHFDKFIRDIIILIDNDVLIDFMGKSNFFYDDTKGFQLIDLDSHTDYKYGLSDQKYDGRLICAYNGFVPCHFAVGTKVLPHLALDEQAISKIDDKQLQQLEQNNRTIFDKCKTAMLNNGVSEEQLNTSLEIIRLFGY